MKALLLKEGVKCDAGLTTDDVRILRVPGTFNHKYDPPRVVELLPLRLATYNFETSFAFLTTIAPVKAEPAVSTVFEAANFAGVTPILAAMPNDNLGDGIEKRGEVLLDPQPVFEQCAFMREARETGGIGLDNPLWNLSVLATTFMENGNAIAHEISEKHAGYTRLIHRRSTIGRWLTALTEELGTQAARPLQGMAANLARRARSSGR